MQVRRLKCGCSEILVCRDSQAATNSSTCLWLFPFSLTYKVKYIALPGFVNSGTPGLTFFPSDWVGILTTQYLRIPPGHIAGIWNPPGELINNAEKFESTYDHGRFFFGDTFLQRIDNAGESRTHRQMPSTFPEVAR